MLAISHFPIAICFVISSFFASTVVAQRAALIHSNAAIFYPAKYNKDKHSPSFALLKEPVEIGKLPADWKNTVSFSSAFGKNLAFINVEENTDLYGTGEVTGPLLRNGTTRKLWNTDNFEYRNDHGQRLYQSHPWVLGVRPDGTAFGVLADNTWKQSLTLREGIQFSSEGPAFSVIVFECETPQKVLQMLAELTGKMELPPLWSLGFQQCRWSYYPDSRVKEIADTFRFKKIPCDVIWMDIHYMDKYKIFSFSPEHFPNPAETNDYLHRKGFKSVWMIDPGVKVEKGYSVYDSGTKEGVWVKAADGKDFVGKVWPGDCVFPDFSQPKTNKWWAEQYRSFMAKGVDGVWNDMNEPAVFEGPDKTMPLDNVHLGGDGLPKDTHLRYHNVYGMMMVKASKNGILNANPDKRPFVLSRSNFLGGQRYAATWTGDNNSNWKHLKMSIPMSINLGLSGQPFNGPDIGGFGGNASPELFAHWIALGAFYPFSRAHSIAGSNPHEPWAFGKKVENVARVALQRRYRLLPYLYTLFQEASHNGMPVMRPVYFADLKDPELRGEESAFLLGEDLLVIPKWSSEPNLPKGNWRTISLVGEDSKNDPYQPEIKLRAGSILPIGKVIQSTTEYSLDSMTLMIALNEKDQANGKMYVDKGEGFGYQKGEFSIFEFTAEIKDNELIVELKNSNNSFNIDISKLQINLVVDENSVSDKIKLTYPVQSYLKN